MSYRIIFLLISTMIFSGCSDKPITLEDITGLGSDIAEVFGKNDSDNYGDSESIAMLEIPPSLDNPNFSDSLRVPKSINMRGEVESLKDAPVLPSYIDMTIMSEGIARWLEMQSDPVSLWPYLNQFWISQGFEIEVSEPINGILETAWRKNQINFKSEGNLIVDKNFNYSSSKEKFRVRLERQPNGYTNIYISNHILEADDVVSEGKIIWKKRGSDLSREAEMLVRMMEYFGTNRDVALESLSESAKYDNKISIDLIDFYGVPAILLEESFSKIWRQIGLSLDRSGLVVTDQNRDKAIYIISTNQISNKKTSYEIKLTKRKDNYIVTAHALNKSKISNEDARKILKHIIYAYSSNLAKN